MNWRPIAVGALSLIALQVFVSGKGPDAAGGLLDWLTRALGRAMSPDVAALPYRGKAAAPAATAPAPAAPGGGIPASSLLPSNPSVTTVTT